MKLPKPERGTAREYWLACFAETAEAARGWLYVAKIDKMQGSCPIEALGYARDDAGLARRYLENFSRGAPMPAERDRSRRGTITGTGHNESPPRAATAHQQDSAPWIRPNPVRPG